MELAQLLSKFSNLKKIKKGGQKIVYWALNQDSQQVALKIIHDAADPRVLQEIAIVQDIQLDHVPRIFESGTVTDNSVGEEALYIVEEYIDGISMRDWLNQGHTANLSLAFNILHTLISIEIELEKKKILHRDINPNNIILGSDGKIYLIDFGLAKKLVGHLSLKRRRPWVRLLQGMRHMSNLQI